MLLVFYVTLLENELVKVTDVDLSMAVRGAKNVSMSTVSAWHTTPAGLNRFPNTIGAKFVIFPNGTRVSEWPTRK